MLPFLFTTFALTTLLWMAFSLLLAWENRRYSLVRLAQPVRLRRREHRVAVLLPCKGDDGDLQSNLAAFFGQKHPNFEIRVIVESMQDAAVPVFQRVQKCHPEVDSQLIVAGQSTSDGQKVHNLRVATRELPPTVKILAFADADICPDPHWLQSLSIRVAQSKDTAAFTGYRWMLPERNSLANWMVYSINSSVAGTLGAGKHFLIWGGSWAIRREKFEALGIRDAWKGTLSDDLVASRVIHGVAGNVRFAPCCLCVTRFDMGWSSALEFLRRQYLIGRKYASHMFWPTYLVLAANVLTWWFLIGMAIFSSGVLAWVALSAAVLIYAVNMFKAGLRQSVFHRKDPVEYESHRPAAWFDILASPIVMTFNWLVMSFSLFGSRICWRGNHYFIAGDGQIRLLNVPAGELPTEHAGRGIDTDQKRAA